MIQTIKTKYNEGQIVFNEELNIPNDSIVYISYNVNSDKDFFLKSSEITLDKIWDNNEDDIYEQLL